MRDVVACRVAIFVFGRVFLDVFKLIGQSAFHIVFGCPVFEQEFESLDVGAQVVARVLHIGAYAEIFACFGLCEPVLSLYVIGFLLFG